jgi:hypothetical protein
MADNGQCNFITPERVALGKRIVDDLDERIRTGRPLNETHRRLIDTSLGLWDAKHLFGEAGLYAYAAIVSRPEDVAEISTPEPEKRLWGKQGLKFQAGQLIRDELIQQAYLMLMEGKELYSHEKRCEAIALALKKIHSYSESGNTDNLPKDDYYQPLIQAYKLNCRVLSAKGIKKALARLL